MPILLNQIEFEEYKKKVEVEEGPYTHHHGEPNQYPCKVATPFLGDDGTVYHTFIYLQEVVCYDCGHKTMIWPEVEGF